MNTVLPQLNTFLVLLLAFQGLLFAIIFFRLKKGLPEIILGYYETFYFIAYTMILLYYLKEYQLFIYAYFLLIPLFALFPVLFYLYIKKIARGNLVKADLAHFIFPVLLLITNLSELPFLTFHEKWAIIIDQSVTNDQHALQRDFLFISKTVYPLLLTIQPFIYILFCTREITFLRKKIRQEYSYSKNINLKWSVELLVIFTILFITSLVVNKYHFSYAIILFVNVFLGVNAVKHMHLHARLSDMNVARVKSKVELLKYSSSCLTESGKRKLYEQLKEYIRTEKKYTNPELRLTDIADDLLTNRQYLSQVINEQTGENFYHFINMYRIEEFINKNKMEPSNLSLEGLAYSVGFKSKSSFYSAFKKEKGCTPKLYFKQKN